MPYDVTIFPESRLGLGTAVGPVTGEDFIEAHRRMTLDRRWEPGFREVWDLSNAAMVDVTPDALNRMMGGLIAQADRLRGSQVAIISSRESVEMLVRLINRLGADIGRVNHLFGTRQDAADWLGVPLPDVAVARPGAE